MAVFQAGDACLLFDRKGRRYLIELIPGAEFHHHHGVLPHDTIIGTEEGTTMQSSLNRPLTLLRPRLADYALKMPRGAAVVYPKDVGAILVWADIRPGSLVLEAGTGSGALTMALARAVGSEGSVVSYELREDHAKLARKRINGFFGEIPSQIDLRLGAVEDGLVELRPDRIVLDVPEPWHTVPRAATNLAPGGIFCCYLPTVPQVQQVRTALDETGAFLDVMTFEMMMREWTIDGRSVRPNHRMIGHTGFITVARKLEPAGD
ncbi:MAG: tRNA (adenine-N1)-methyltransferase [Acidimicrobiia bacterium]|nr:tRNA (adenine-N1)-methyltransferase [Acidimicrobiia bacterium]MDX2468176.1 tRNA (adenine-N1)-methyltransferase [Acidimicrobiia bacterium]